MLSLGVLLKAGRQRADFGPAATTVKHNIDTTSSTDTAPERLAFIAAALLSFQRPEALTHVF